MLFGETFAVYFENHTEHTDTLCGQNAEFFNVETGGIYSYHFKVFVLVWSFGYSLADNAQYFGSGLT
jgi:hypothetical protein